MASSVVQINKAYLIQLRGELQQKLDEVNAQLEGVGKSNYVGTTAWIEPVDDTLSVMAGGAGTSAGGGNSGGSSGGFGAAVALNAALQSFGGSAQQELQWLKTVLTDMIAEITTTISQFTDSDTLNAQLASNLDADFTKTIGALQAGPTTGTSSGGTSTGGTGSGTGTGGTGSGTGTGGTGSGTGTGGTGSGTGTGGTGSGTGTGGTGSGTGTGGTGSGTGTGGTGSGTGTGGTGS